MFVNPSLGIYNEIQPEPEPQDEPITIYVSGGSFSSPYYQFYSDSAGANEIDGLYLSDAKYEFKMLNNGGQSHPFFISDVGYKQPSNTLTFTGDINYMMGISGTQSFIVSLNNLPTSSPIYYY